MNLLKTFLLFSTIKSKKLLLHNTLNINTLKNMIILLSPSKSLDEKAAVIEPASSPMFLPKSTTLIKKLQKLSCEEIAELMKISEKLAFLNFQRFQKWQLPFNQQNATTAIFTFNGDVYDGLQAKSFTTANIEFAKSHVLILSGLYGLLRPLDLIQPYRLEMGIKLKTQLHNNLYSFWGDLLTETINKIAKNNSQKCIINLASDEYFKVINPKKTAISIITPVFKQEELGKFKFVSFYAKKARGFMTHFIVKNRITNPEDIKAFDYEGYSFNSQISSKDIWAFTR